MTFVVPFDGSDLAETALVRAREFSEAVNERVISVTVIPKSNTEYARDHGWLRHDEPFDMESIVTSLHEQVMYLTPDADFNHIVVDKYAPSGSIVKKVRRFAKSQDASMVFIGSDNAGSMVTHVSDVGSGITAEDSYDVVIIRTKAPSKVAAIRDTSPFKPPKSDFYIP